MKFSLDHKTSDIIISMTANEIYASVFLCFLAFYKISLGYNLISQFFFFLNFSVVVFLAIFSNICYPI